MSDAAPSDAVRTHPRVPPWLATMQAGVERLWWLFPLLLVVIAYRHSPQFGLLSDAEMLIANNDRLRAPGALWKNLTTHYFWASWRNFIPYWRPFTKGSWVLEYRIFDGWPGGFHLVQVGWHLVGIGGVMAIARALDCGRLAAAGAGLLYGLHPAHIEPVCSIMARSDVVSTSAMLWSLAAFLRLWATGSRRWLVMHATALLVALASKETAVVVLPVITLLSLLVPAGGTLATKTLARRRMVAWAPAVCLTVSYLVGRSVVLGARQGDGLAFDPVRIVVAGGMSLARMLPLALDTPLLAPLRNPTAEPWQVVRIAIGWLLAVLLVVATVKHPRREAQAIFAWGLLALAPTLLVADMHVPVGQLHFPAADRWILPGVAAVSIAVVLLIRWMGRARAAAPVVVGIWAAAVLWMSSDTHAAYRSHETLEAELDRIYEQTPLALRNKRDDCLHRERLWSRALRQGRPGAVIDTAQQTLATCNRDGLRLLLLQAFVQARKGPEAWQAATYLMKSARLERRYHAQAYFYAGAAALLTERWSQALQYLDRARRLGLRDCNVHRQIGMCHARLGRPGEAMAEYEKASRCAPQAAGPHLAMAELALRAGETARARAALEAAARRHLEPAERRAHEMLVARLRAASP